MIPGNLGDASGCVAYSLRGCVHWWGSLGTSWLSWLPTWAGGWQTPMCLHRFGSPPLSLHCSTRCHVFNAAGRPTLGAALRWPPQCHVFNRLYIHRICYTRTLWPALLSQPRNICVPCWAFLTNAWCHGVPADLNLCLTAFMLWEDYNVWLAQTSRTSLFSLFPSCLGYFWLDIWWVENCFSSFPTRNRANQLI